MNKSLKSQKGQALIFVIGTMTIAMAVGVGIAVRNISSISRSSRSDTATRAQAAAEAGLEKYLSMSDSDLEMRVGAGVETTTLPSEDNIQSQYSVTVGYYGSNLEADYLPLAIGENEVSQVVLGGSDVIDKICWSPTDNGTDLFLTAYSEDAEDEDDISSFGIKSGDGPGDSNFESATIDAGDFDYCYDGDIPLPNNPEILRVRSIGGESSVGVYPVPSGLPNQGFEIESVGTLTTSDPGTDDVESTVKARKSFSYLPGFFDFAIYSGQGL